MPGGPVEREARPHGKELAEHVPKRMPLINSAAMAAAANSAMTGVRSWAQLSWTTLRHIVEIWSIADFNTSNVRLQDQESFHQKHQGTEPLRFHRCCRKYVVVADFSSTVSQ